MRNGCCSSETLKRGKTVVGWTSSLHVWGSVVLLTIFVLHIISYFNICVILITYVREKKKKPNHGFLTTTLSKARCLYCFTMSWGSHHPSFCRLLLPSSPQPPPHSELQSPEEERRQWPLLRVVHGDLLRNKLTPKSSFCLLYPHTPVSIESYKQIVNLSLFALKVNPQSFFTFPDTLLTPPSKYLLVINFMQNPELLGGNQFSWLSRKCKEFSFTLTLVCTLFMQEGKEEESMHM